MLILKICFFMVLILEVFLSHQNGSRSREESRALSSFIHMNERVLRILAHAVFFLILMFLAFRAFSTRWAAAGIAVWTLADEATKPLISGRHFNWSDVGWNIAGAVLGGLVYYILCLGQAV